MPEIVLRTVLQRVSDELDRLRGLGLDTQKAVGLLAGTEAERIAIPDAALVGLQGLDALVQHLAALSGFLAAVAADLPERVGVDADAATLHPPLAALRARLLGQEAPVQAAAEVELF